MTFVGSSGWAEEIIVNSDENQNRLFHTADTGAHWVDVTPRHCTNCGVSGVVFATATTAISVAAPLGGALPVPVELATTHDGGHTWQRTILRIAFPVATVRGAFTSGGSFGLLTIEMQHGSGVLGVTQVWSTSDGGSRWTKVADGAPAGDLAVVTPHLAFVAVLQQDVLLGSTDGGATWQPVLQGAISAPQFSDTTHGSILAGRYDPAIGLSSVVLYRTSNGGASWLAGTALTDSLLANYGGGTGPAWAGRGMSEAVIVVSGDIWVTNDSGMSWAETATSLAAQDALAIDGNGRIYADYYGSTCPGKANCVSDAALQASSDGGHTWRVVPAL